MRFFVGCGLLACLALSASAASLPDAFFGHFVLDHSVNFDEYLTAKGYSWFTRKLIVFATFEKVFKKADGDKFDYDNLTTKKNIFYKNIEIGKEFVGEGLDSTNFKITWTARDGKIYEKHVPVDTNSEAKEEEYKYYMDGEFLVVEMEANGVIGKRYYKKKQ